MSSVTTAKLVNWKEWAEAARNVVQSCGRPSSSSSTTLPSASVSSEEEKWISSCSDNVRLDAYRLSLVYQSSVFVCVWVCVMYLWERVCLNVYQECAGCTVVKVDTRANQHFGGRMFGCGNDCWRQTTAKRGQQVLECWSKVTTTTITAEWQESAKKGESHDLEVVPVLATVRLKWLFTDSNVFFCSVHWPRESCVLLRWQSTKHSHPPGCTPF